jgi:hypothetical protein
LRAHSRPPRIAILISLLAAAALLAVTGCGGGGNSTGARALIDKAFKQPIHSALVTINLQASLSGVPQLSQPIQLRLAGPFKSNGHGKLPSLDWKVDFSGGGQAFSAGLVSTGDDAFVNFQGQNYEVGKAQVAQFNSQLAAQAQNRNRQSLKSFGIDPRDWISNPQEKGDQTVNGVATNHVQAGIDVGKLLNDLNKVLAKAGSLGTTVAAPRQIPKSVIDSAKNIVKNPKFDLYSGKVDNVIRRLAVAIDFSVPSGSQAKVGGLKSGTVNFTVDFTNVGQPQTITAPTGAKPIGQLTQQLGGLGGLGGGLGGGSAAPGGGGSGGNGPSASQFNRYQQCIQRTNPSDVAGLQKCAQLLKPGH